VVRHAIGDGRLGDVVEHKLPLRKFLFACDGEVSRAEEQIVSP